jgi:hypothetical protein
MSTFSFALSSGHFPMTVRPSESVISIAATSAFDPTMDDRISNRTAFSQALVDSASLGFASKLPEDSPEVKETRTFLLTGKGFPLQAQSSTLTNAFTAPPPGASGVFLIGVAVGSVVLVTVIITVLAFVIRFTKQREMIPESCTDESSLSDVDAEGTENPLMEQDQRLLGFYDEYAQQTALL